LQIPLKDIHIVAPDEQSQTDFMHQQRLRERKGLPDKTCQALTQCIVKSLHMSRLSRLFSDCSMLFGWDNALICRPEICVTDTTTIARWYRTPELSAGHLAPITDDKRHNLPRFPTQCQPYPRLIGFLANKGPELITFEGDGTRIVWLWRDERLLERRQLLGFFLTNGSPSRAQHRTCAPIRASYYVPDRREGSLPFAPPNSQRYSGFRDFAVRMCYSGTSVFRSVQCHIYSDLGCRNGGRRSVVSPWCEAFLVIYGRQYTTPFDI
jgi:hypothetical protein